MVKRVLMMGAQGRRGTGAVTAPAVFTGTSVMRERAREREQSLLLSHIVLKRFD